MASIPETVAPLRAGDPRRLGDYRLEGRLGAGGQGAVYLGTAPDGRLVAVKLLHAEQTEDPRARERFVREARAAMRVARFCTAQVLDADVAGDLPYLVSEYVPGPSLYRLVAERGPITGAALDRLAIGVVTALVAIHRAGIVHRDLKPGNVLIAADGPRVIDFGIAKDLDGEATTSSRIVGTPAYMSPEQLAGGPVTPAVDVFAWGAMIAYVATGQAPFGSDTIPLVVNRIINAEPELSGLPEPMRSLVADCLAKDAARRPTARQILLRLLGQEDEPVPAPATTGEDGMLARAATLAAVGLVVPGVAAAGTVADGPTDPAGPGGSTDSEVTEHVPPPPPPPEPQRPLGPVAYEMPGYGPVPQPPLPTIPAAGPRRAGPRVRVAMACTGALAALVVTGIMTMSALGDSQDARKMKPAAGTSSPSAGTGQNGTTQNGTGPYAGTPAQNDDPQPGTSTVPSSPTTGGTGGYGGYGGGSGGNGGYGGGGNGTHPTPTPSGETTPTPSVTPTPTDPSPHPSDTGTTPEGGDGDPSTGDGGTGGY
ncbi:serine/threonine-protein kinase [Thermomonospora umbrina]|uniref:Serine/threonine protein kinase n=1 Tax=Thermomonospora umbrina TaxID=111806 RepID=A0A3D9SRC3_9ACTN|nr:serine/threonine-protein kinase [Thermomonospora umbrina]REE98492.1 serine/threonine protein kinase [Thermomonospora umbrina]